MTDGLPTLTIWQPYASLIVLGVKTIETRSWAAPEHLIGQRIGIHAAARRPDEGLRLGPDTPITTEEYLVSDGSLLDLCNNVAHPLPLGAVLGTVRLAACVPIALLLNGLDGHMRFAPTGADLEDQRPYGDFAPGRWAWLLEDPQPTTSQCPWCAGRGGTPEEVPIGRGDVFPDPGWVENCPTCDGAGRCDPIPARGRQRVWYWTPDQGKDEAA